MGVGDSACVLSIPSTGRSWLKRFAEQHGLDEQTFSFNTLYGSFLVEATLLTLSKLSAEAPFNTLYGSFLVEAE